MSEAVSIVIVNYNGERFIIPCLASVLAQTRPFDEILVVDNASTDSSVGLIRSRFPQVRLIPLELNVGYAEGCNCGIRAAAGELVAVLNNDAILDAHWLENLLEHNHEPWDFWASLVVFADDPDMVDSAGDGMAVIGAAYKIGHGERRFRYGEPREVFGPCGAAALYRRSMLLATGGFDSDFFLVYEDADLNIRARLKGFRCLYVPAAKVRHRVNASIGSFSHNYVFFGHRNSEYVFWKNMPLPLLLIYLPERLFFDLFCFVFFLLRNRHSAFLQAKADFVRNLRPVFRKRRTVQASRVISLWTLRRLLTRNWLRHRLKK